MYVMVSNTGETLHFKTFWLIVLSSFSCIPERNYKHIPVVSADILVQFSSSVILSSFLYLFFKSLTLLMIEAIRGNPLSLRSSSSSICRQKVKPGKLLKSPVVTGINWNQNR